MKKSIFYIGLILLAASLSPAMAMLDGDDGVPPHRTITVQGPYVLDLANDANIRNILNANGNVSINVNGDMRIRGGRIIVPMGNLDITCTGGTFENQGLVVAPHITLINTGRFVNHGRIEPSLPR